MSLNTNLTNFATRIAGEFRVLRASIALANGNLATLSTTSKQSLVAAINELDTAMKALVIGSGAISDGQTTSGTTWSSTKTAATIAGLIGDSLATGATKTYSIDKIRTLLTTMRSELKNEILDGSGAALDTLKELSLALASNPNFAASIAADLALRVRFDAPQVLTKAQLVQVYTNLDLGNPDTDYVAAFNAGLNG